MTRLSAIIASTGASAGGSSTTVYATPNDLPLSSNSAGDLAYVTSTNRLYIWNGDGWYNIALINTSPTITTAPYAEYVFATDGTPIVLNLAASDPEGIPITWSYAVTSGSLGSAATISQSDNVFTLTPSTTEAHAGTFSVTFTASDGVNLATAASSFTLAFVRYADYTSTKNATATLIPLSAPLPTTTWFEVADEYSVVLQENLIVDLDLWGGGGGAGATWVGSVSNGGAGGYAYARGLRLPAGSYKFVVGAGGIGGVYQSGETQAVMDANNEDFGNGGLGTQGNFSGTGQNNGGVGGGFTGIFATSVSQANSILIAGGGGAGSGSSSYSGGQGGGTSGTNGQGLGGGGGTQSAGGAAGGAGATSGNAGTALQGGDGIVGTGFGGGGGGGGYFGGGSAGLNASSGSGAGGGGSGFITTTYTKTSSGSETSAVRRTPLVTASGAPSNPSAGYGGEGNTSRPNANGKNGALKFTITGTY